LIAKTTFLFDCSSDIILILVNTTIGG